MRMIKCLVLFSTLLLIGCAQVDAGKKVLAQKGATLSDSALVDAVWWTCQGSSVGAVKRMYGASAERADLYREFCQGSGTANVVAP